MGRRSGKRIETGDGLRVVGKNANGEGSVYQDGDRWVATWWVLGEKRPRKATGRTRQDAMRRREQRRAQTAPTSSDLGTVGQLADWWLRNTYKAAVSIDTWQKARERLPRIHRTIGHRKIRDVDYGVVVEWQAKLLDSPDLQANTVRNYRQTLALIFDDAVKLGLIQGNPVRSMDPPAATEPVKPVLDSGELHAFVKVLLAHADEWRNAAAAGILYQGGWRVSEVLGLAWDDVDLEELVGTAAVRRVSVYRKGAGMVLKPWAKKPGAHGEHFLSPSAVALLRARRLVQQQERELAGDRWTQQTMDGRPVDLIFTNTTGGLVLRQHVEKVIERAAKEAGVDPTGLSTHGGRRSVITALWSEGGESLEDIANHVGHADTKTTARYVKRLGRRPKDVAARAAALLDPTAE